MSTGFEGVYERAKIADKISEAMIAKELAREGWEGALQALRPPVTNEGPDGTPWLFVHQDSSRELAMEWHAAYMRAFSNWTLLRMIFAKTSDPDAKHIMIVKSEEI